jgi:hypothetical protein
LEASSHQIGQQRSTNPDFTLALEESITTKGLEQEVTRLEQQQDLIYRDLIPNCRSVLRRWWNVVLPKVLVAAEASPSTRFQQRFVLCKHAQRDLAKLMFRFDDVKITQCHEQIAIATAISGVLLNQKIPFTLPSSPESWGD